MQQPTATMAAPLPFGRRPSGSFASDFPGGSDPRLSAAHGFAPAHHHQNHPFSHPTSDLASNYQYTSGGRAPFEPELPFDANNNTNISSWFYGNAQEPTVQSIAEAGLPYHLDPYAPHTSTTGPNNVTGNPVPPINSNGQGHSAVSGPPAPNFPAKSTPFSPTAAAPFGVVPPASVPPPSAPGASHSLASAVPPFLGARRSSDEQVQGSTAPLSMSETGSSVANGPSQSGHVHSAPESIGFNGSISPNSSARMSGSPEAHNASHMFPAYTTAPVPPPGGMVMGAPVSSSVLESIDSWLAPAPSAPMAIASSITALPSQHTDMGEAKMPVVSARNISPPEVIRTNQAVPSSRASASAVFHPGSSSTSSASALPGAPFKTSTERRERNKASQRESRKRKQDRMETLESENAALRKALADMKKFSHALSNGAGIRGEDGSEVAPIQLTKFTGAFHLDLIESHLDDESAEADWKGMVGYRFPPSSSQAKDWDGSMPALASSISDSDEDNSCDDANAAPTQKSAQVKDEADSETLDKGKASADVSQPTPQQVKKAMWEISLNQKRQKAAQSFPSMVAVPELVLYKVCRLYYSTLLPFTTKLKSGIINLRAAREMPGFGGGYDDLPRFPGDPSFGATELYLPKNLMPTEMQMRIGFHPVEIAVMPYPALRDRILTILSAFHAIEELAQEEEQAATERFSEEAGSTTSQSGNQEQQSETTNATANQTSDTSNTEPAEEDIRRRTALVADMSAWKPKDFQGAVVIPDKSRAYSYGFLDKPRGSHRLRKPAQRWLDDFFYEIVQTLRVWSPAGDVFDGECFEFKESFFRKYPYMVDSEMLRATNRWRRARGEDPIRL